MQSAYVLSGLLVAGLGLGLAQTPNASLGGTVADMSGAVVPNVKVTATGIDTGVETKTFTNGAGAYEFPSLQAGNYRVVAETTGFQTAIYEPVVLGVSANMRLNFTLAMAGSRTAVEVTAAAESPLLTASSVVGGVISGQQINDLPLIDRDATNLALTQAGFAGGVGNGVNVAGGETQALLVTVNGINVTNTRQTAFGGLNSGQLSQSIDLVEEVKVVTSPVDVELGRALGQVQMIVRSGTNQFHGSAVDGLRNTDLNTNTFFNNLNRLAPQTLKRNQYAARIGGPIRKNRTFFFFLYDGDRQRTSSLQNPTVLTPTARQGIFRFYPGVADGNVTASVPTVDVNGNSVQPSSATGPLQTVSVFGLDPNRMTADPTGTIQKFLAQVPLPNNYLVGDGLNTAGYVWQQPALADRDQFTFKVDHYFNEKHHINVVVTHQKDSITNTPPTYPGAIPATLTGLHSWFGSLGFTSTPLPTLLNEFRLGFQHPIDDQVGSPRAYPSLFPQANGVPYQVSGTAFAWPIPSSDDAHQTNPVYTLADGLSWTRGRHFFKWGGQFDALASNAYNVAAQNVPTVTIGAGSVAVTGIGSIAGIGQNQTAAQNLLTTLSGSVSQVSNGYAVATGVNPQWVPGYPSIRVWHQRDISGFFKDDFKVTSNFTLNYGIRWDWVGVPWESYGRAVEPVGGAAGLFGISGTNYSALWQPGLAQGALTQIETVGKNSANPDVLLYHNYYKGFAPGVGFSWSIPYFGKDKTVFRMGYGMSRPPAQSILGIDNTIQRFLTTTTYVPTTPCLILCVALPLPPGNSNPLAPVPLTDRTQSISAYNPDFIQPIVQNWNASLERQITPTSTLSIRYVGNKSTHLVGGVAVNSANIFENGILSAFDTTIAGGDAPLFNQIFNGLNLGLGPVNGTTVTGSQSLRQYSTTKTYFANDNAGSFASWLNSTNALTGVNGGLLSRAGLPQNFVVVNPQYSRVTLTCSCANGWYDSAVIEFHRRFANGWTVQTNYTFAKTLLMGSGTDNGATFSDPRNWALSKSRAPYDITGNLKASGTYMLPFGPGKRFLNGTSGFGGFLAGLMSQWQVGGILTMSSGAPLAITSSATSFNNTSGTATVVGSLPSDLGSVTKTGTGVTYFAGLQQITDPSVNNLTTLQTLRSSSTLKAITYNGNVLFENPAPGTMGTLASYSSLNGPRLFDLDMDLLKRFRVKERYLVDFRVDAIGITNTPHFSNPNTNIDSTSFGQITDTGGGFVQPGQPVFFEGNRVIVANLRISF
jgi:hypothetical protein